MEVNNETTDAAMHWRERSNRQGQATDRKNKQPTKEQSNRPRQQKQPTETNSHQEQTTDRGSKATDREQIHTERKGSSYRWSYINKNKQNKTNTLHYVSSYWYLDGREGDHLDDGSIPFVGVGLRSLLVSRSETLGAHCLTARATTSQRDKTKQ
jgi:hypothetical protein